MDFRGPCNSYGSFTANPPFWIPIHIVIPERPTECAVFNVIAAGWPNFLCVCSVFSSGSVQLHWAQWPPNQSGAASKWYCTSKGLLGAGPSGIMAADAIVTDGGALHVAGVPIVNPATVVVWEVTPGPGNGFQAVPKSSTGTGVPLSLLSSLMECSEG